ncbi:MAG: CDP-alcohol phosphatidyltransferase family protein [Firmicutes bacterium]|nr:CDP-alcohol phosphatidyltransferase family protein [Bacillota bacterium]
MFTADWKKEIFTIPNLLSLFRLLLIPVYMGIYLQAEDMADYALAAGILAVSCATDAIDGKIARRFGMISNLGKVLDPIADKATQFSLIIVLSIRRPVLWILVGMFVVKESFQLIAGAVMLRKGKMLSGALMAGKVCTTVLFVSLILMVLLPDMSKTVVNILCAVDALFMLISFVSYARVYFLKSPKIQDL